MGADTFHFDLLPADLDSVRVDTAYMIARRGWPVDSRITLDRERHRITCRILEPGGLASSAALVLQVDLPEVGNLKLRTTLLPPREEPYDLLLELARERIRHFIQKCEDWQMFTPSLTAEARERIEHARSQLAAAVLAGDPATEAERARESVIAAVQAGELLASSYADILLHHRFGHSAAAETSLGFRVDPRSQPPEHEPPDLAEFGVVMVETPWSLLQPEPGDFDFAAVDRWVEWSRKRRIPLVLGPLVDLREEVLPDWMLPNLGDYGALCRSIWQHQEQIVSRYGAHVAIWCVTSGVHVNRLARLSHEQMIDVTRRSAVLVLQAQRNAKVMVELVQPFDDEVALHPDSVRGYEYAVRALDEGVHIDCIGLSFECGIARNGSETRDLLALSDMIDGIGRLEPPVMITGYAAPAGNDDPAAGTWHSPWTEERQACWATTLYGIALGKMTQRGESARNRRVGVVESVLWNRLQESAGEPPLGLLDRQGTPRRVFRSLAAVRRALRRPLGKSNIRPGDFAANSESLRK